MYFDYYSTFSNVLILVLIHHQYCTHENILTLTSIPHNFSSYLNEGGSVPFMRQLLTLLNGTDRRSYNIGVAGYFS